MVHTTLLALLGGSGFFVGAIEIGEQTGITIGCAFVIGGIIYWVGRKIQKFDDSIQYLRQGQMAILDRIRHLPCERGLGRLPDSCKPKDDDDGTL